MTLAEIFNTENPSISFELFPPRTAKGERNLYRHVEQLMKFNPAFITCTYGAGGSTRDKTLEIIKHVKQQFGLPVASHLTVVGSHVDDLRKYLRSAVEAGIDYIVALRGDPPEGQAEFQQTAGGLQYANELVQLIREEFGDFGVLVAGYPEKHREAPSMDVDLDNLKRKVDAGADVIVTQLFFNNEDFWRFRDKCEALGINVPIIPGLLPVTSLAQIKRIASLCAASLPAEFLQRLGEKDDAQWQTRVGVEHAIQQTRELLDRGVPGLHFYVLNKSDATTKILEAVT